MTTQNIKLLGWMDTEQPATQKEAEQYEFRIRLSEVPSATWKRAFAESSKDQLPRVSMEQKVMVLSCELTGIESAIRRVKQRVHLVNEMLVRQEREVDEQVARQMREAEERRLKVLAAVKGINFDEP